MPVIPHNQHASFAVEEIPVPGFQKLLAVIRRLRNPQDGCPWDLKQTHVSLRPYLLEEAYEAVDAIDEGDSAHLKEELGDVLLQVVLHAQLATDDGQFTADDVADGIAEKLIRRHPHVFGEVKVENAEAVTENWQAIKAAERGEPANTSIMEKLPKGVPALNLAYDVSKRAVSQGFEWPDFESLWACVMSEYDEFRHEVDNGGTPEALEDEMGDILFAAVNLARFHKIHPEVALNKATQKFLKRYRLMESLADAPLNTLDFETLDSLWTQAKKQLSSGNPK